MSWNKVDIQCKIMYGEHFFGNPKPEDRKFIISTIAEEFPQFSRIRIAAVVDHCFKINPVPLQRRTFLTFLQSSLR